MMAKCGCKCDVYSRVVGYFRPTHLWNKGKLAEWKERKNFDIPTKQELKKES